MKRRLAATLCALLLVMGAASAIAEQEVSIWSWVPIPRIAEKMFATVEEEYPDITVKFTQYNYNPEYLTALAAGAGADNLPDILGLQAGSLTQQYRDYLIDLTPYAVETWGEDWEESFYHVVSSEMRLGNPEGDDSVYIIPVESQIINILYNTKIFDELGLKAPATWQELIDISAKLTENGYAPLYFGGSDGWQHVNVYLMLATQYGDQIYAAQDGSGQWTDENLVAALEAYQSMFTDGIMQVGALSNNSYPDGVNLFTAGKVGMMALGSWWWQEYSAPEPVALVADWSYDSFYLPAYSENGTASPAIGSMGFGFGISKDCEDPEAAWKVLASLAAGKANQQNVNDMGNLPAIKGLKPEGVDADIVAQIEGYLAVLDGAKGQRIASPEVENALQNALQGVAAGQLEPLAALESVQAVQDQVLGK